MIFLTLCDVCCCAESPNWTLCIPEKMGKEGTCRNAERKKQTKYICTYTKMIIYVHNLISPATSKPAKANAPCWLATLFPVSSPLAHCLLPPTPYQKHNNFINNLQLGLFESPIETYPRKRTNEHGTPTKLPLKEEGEIASQNTILGGFKICLFFFGV